MPQLQKKIPFLQWTGENGKKVWVFDCDIGIRLQYKYEIAIQVSDCTTR